MRLSRSYMILGSVLAMIGIATTALALKSIRPSPVRIVRDAVKSLPSSSANVLYRQEGVAVLREPFAHDDDFADLYAINTHDHFAPIEFFEGYGETLAFEPGKFAIMRIHPDRIGEFSGRMHHINHACGAITRLTGVAESKAVIATPTPLIPVTSRDARIAHITQMVRAENIQQTMRELSTITTRYHTSSAGQGVASWLADKYQALAAGRTDVTITTYDHGRETPQDSLIVRIEGRTRPEEVLILGSHIDSVNWSDGTSARSPGADDNASGTATNLEIFRLIMAEGIEFDRTLEIHGYAAEEVGLVGSADIATDYRARGVKVIAMVQHDMTAWKAPGTPDKIWLVTSNTDSRFNDLLGNLIQHYAGMPFEKASLSSGSSDHASWRRAGYATAFPFENPRRYNRAIHTESDNLESASATTQVAGFAKLGLAYAMHFGGIQSR